MFEMTGTPVYIFTGLLESGKTTLIYEVADEEDFLEEGTTLLIQCEEGETEFDEEFLKNHQMVLINVSEKEQLCGEFWERLDREYEPAQVMIEYNGMWEMDALFGSDAPEHWEVGGIYSTVNGETAELYINNMRKTFMKPLRDSNLIIFNRCDDETDRRKYRRNLKAMNPQVQVVFERKDGVLYENEKDEVPFDYSGTTVEIEDFDYGLWYIDAMENPEHYLGKKVSFCGRYCESAEPGSKCCVVGRHVMTCCEEDIQFLGFICYFDEEPGFKHGDWVRLDAAFDYGECDAYGPGEDGPMLYLEKIQAADKPENELVMFV